MVQLLYVQLLYVLYHDLTVLNVYSIRIIDKLVIQYLKSGIFTAISLRYETKFKQFSMILLPKYSDYHFLYDHDDLKISTISPEDDLAAHQSSCLD